MTTLKPIFVASILALASACATAPPVPVALDTSVPAVAEADGLRAELRVLSRAESARQFGGDVGESLRVVQAKFANTGARGLSVERKTIQLVAPDGKEAYPLSPFSVANAARGGPAMTSTGSNAADWILVIFQVAALARPPG